MKIWKEYSEKICNYYEWIGNDRLENLVVMSYNISGIAHCKEEFWQYCKNELSKDLLFPNSIYVYMIANEKINNKNSKVECYKKCWKKIADLFDINGFELGLEIEHKYNENQYYSGIAKTTLNNLENLLKILEFKGKKYVIFMSRRDYFQDINDMKKLILNYALFDKYGDIDYYNIFHLCNNNDDIICRYGVDSIGAEFAMIINKDNINSYISNESTFMA